MKFKNSFIALFISCILAFISIQAFASSTVGEAVDDSMITTKINAKMLADKNVSSLNVKIKTNDGVVFVSGNIPSTEEASRVVEIANSVPGVVDVDTTNLKVKNSDHLLADSYITAKIKGIYVREKVFGDKDIPFTKVHVETKNGIVYLSGEVDNPTEKKNAEELAKTIKGVKSVESRELNLK